MKNEGHRASPPKDVITSPECVDRFSLPDCNILQASSDSDCPRLRAPSGHGALNVEGLSKHDMSGTDNSIRGQTPDRTETS